MTETPILSGFSCVRGIRFTFRFRKTITIAARARNMRAFTAPLPWRCPLTGSRLRLRPMTGSSRVSRAPLQCSGVPDRPLAGNDGGDCRDDGSSRRKNSRPRAGNDQINNLPGMGRSKAPGSKCAGFGERGRRRTRQDQISLGAQGPVKLRSSWRSAPNEENLFLLPDRFSMERLSSSKDRSSRLT
jgi:hypothetical protein